MRLLLDTHIFIWACQTPERLSPLAREAIEAPGNVVLISAATIWEISIKAALDKITFPIEKIDALLDDMGFEALPIAVNHAAMAGRLPRHHNDPFDRMLIAQALCDGLTLVSDDALIRRYDLPLLGR